MAEKKEYDHKAFAVANLNTQKANMHIDLEDVDDREAALGKKKKVPVLTIKGSPFDHTRDFEALSIKRMWDGAEVKPRDSDGTINEGHTLMTDGLTITITGEESLKVLADAGVEFPGVTQFMSRTKKVVRGGSGSMVV